MRGQVVAIFGGSGFIGRHLVHRLAQRGAILRIATRNPAAAIHLKPQGAIGQIVLAPTALSDEVSLMRLISGADHVINLVGILYESRKADFERLQGRLPGRIGRIAAEHGVKSFVQMSAIGADPGSTSLYARTKAMGEGEARSSYPGVTIIRPSIVFGPEDSFFNRFAGMSRFAPALPLIGGGQTRFQPVYVGDVADAIVATIERSELRGHSYELGGPRIYTFKELLRYMLGVLERPRLLVNVPWGAARFQARILELLPIPPLTRDQVELLKTDNVVAAGARGFIELDIAPTPIEAVVPRYLRPSIRHGGHIPTA
jgi:uncharacterized protein YbjT (DUF2867 family)